MICRPRSLVSTSPALLAAGLLVLATLATAAAAADPALTPAARAPADGPPKAPPAAAPAAAREPAGPRQGGDTILTATPLTLPVHQQTGTTAGYADDYDEVCPYSGSTSPDVVYSFDPTTSMVVDIDMLGSSYDTKIYVYDEDLGLVACNDDFYADYVSRIEHLPLIVGTRYYLVIDGYGGDAGDYVLTIAQQEPCEIAYVPGSQDEEEPPLMDGYVDVHNSGCSGPDDGPFQVITSPTFMGRSGWYLDADDQPTRDTDWFALTIDGSGSLEMVGDAEQPCYMYAVSDQNCEWWEVVQYAPIGPCQEGILTVSGPPGAGLWLGVVPQRSQPPDGFVGHEFAYRLSFNISVAVEAHTLTEVKALFH